MAWLLQYVLFITAVCCDIMFIAVYDYVIAKAHSDIVPAIHAVTVHGIITAVQIMVLLAYCMIILCTTECCL